MAFLAIFNPSYRFLLTRRAKYVVGLVCSRFEYLSKMIRDGLKASVLPGDDALQGLEKHLAKLVGSVDAAQDAEGKPKYSAQDKDTFVKELAGFQKLFTSFLPQRGRVINWNKISPPPEGMISAYNDLQVCHF